MSFRKAMVIFISVFLCASQAFAAVKVKLFVVNPSDDKTTTLPVRYDFPAEIKQEDILDAGGLLIDYDPQKNVYFAHQDITLDAKQTKELQIVIQDKWDIPSDKVDSLRNKLGEKLNTMKNSSSYDTAKMLADNINLKLDDISKSQTEAAGDIERKIGLYRANKERLSQLENDILSLDYLAIKSSGMENARTVRYVVEATNTAEEEAETTVTSYLPKGVQPEYLVSNPGFDIGYDNKVGQYYLSKKEKLKAGERKKYELEIKDMWSFSPELMDKYAREADDFKSILKETKYNKLGDMLLSDITKSSQEILETQKTASGIRDKISLYNDNLEREKKIKQSLDKMKGLIADIVRAQEFFSVLKEQDPQAQLKIADIKKKENIPKAEVWQVFLIVIIFLIIFSIFVGLFWYRRLKADTGSAKYNKITKPKQQSEVK
ncbi:MAG: hypothetical protein MUF05_04000 [Candidatus Omnitrophica bacterium]|jgi:hypothetical protein|nr:hypothetical protein [Candidatus Omnitrophota bacterium]